MELTVVPESFPKHHWPVEKPQLKLNGLMTFIAVILGLIAGLFNTVGIYLLTVYYLLPFEFVLPGNLVSRFILFLIGFIFAIYLSILFYEGSQILVGVLLGYRASLLQVGPLALVRTATGWRLRRISQEFLLLGGVNYCGPLTTKQLRLRYIIYALSGYLLTFLLWYVLLISGSALPADNVPRWLAILLDLLMISTTYALWHKLLSTVNGVAIAFSRRLNMGS